MISPDLAARLVSAYTSGDYGQLLPPDGHLAVSVGDGEVRYSALGVVCAIAVADGVIQPPVSRQHPVLDDARVWCYGEPVTPGDNTGRVPHAVSLPPVVMAHYGFSVAGGDLIEVAGQTATWIRHEAVPFAEFAAALAAVIPPAVPVVTVAA